MDELEDLRDLLGDASERTYAFVTRASSAPGGGSFALRFGPMSLDAALALKQWADAEAIPVQFSADCGLEFKASKVRALFADSDAVERRAARAAIEEARDLWAGAAPADAMRLMLTTALTLYEAIDEALTPRHRERWLDALDKAAAPFNHQQLKAAPIEQPRTSIGALKAMDQAGVHCTCGDGIDPHDAACPARAFQLGYAAANGIAADRLAAVGKALGYSGQFMAEHARALMQSREDDNALLAKIGERIGAKSRATVFPALDAIERSANRLRDAIDWMDSDAAAGMHREQLVPEVRARAHYWKRNP